MPSPRPRKPIFSFVVALMLTRPGWQAQASRRAGCASSVEMRRDLGSFGNECGVDVDDASHRGRRGFRPRACEDVRAADAADGFVGVRKMMADVARRNRAEQRVGDGMDQHVGVRVSFQSFGVWNLHAAENQRTAFHQRMHVVPDAGKCLACAIERVCGIRTACENKSLAQSPQSRKGKKGGEKAR